MFGAFVFGQNTTSPVKTWKKIHDENGFKQSENYKGPPDDAYIYPSSMQENSYVTKNSPNNYTNSNQGMVYTEEDLYGNGEGTGSGNIEKDPSIKPAKPIDLPDIDAPEVPVLSGSFWKYLGIILLIICLAYLAYVILKNRTRTPKKVSFEALPEEFNPEEISKTELELRLEEALAHNNFKECVRIYLLFALKELIENKRIFWKKEKTNVHYILELSGYSQVGDFEQLVAIYDLLWYGNYTLNQEAFLQLERQLKTYYHNIQGAK